MDYSALLVFADRFVCIGSPQTAAMNAASPANRPTANRPTPELPRHSTIASPPKPQPAATAVATPTLGPPSTPTSVFTLNQDQVLKKHSGKVILKNFEKNIRRFSIFRSKLLKILPNFQKFGRFFLLFKRLIRGSGVSFRYVYKCVIILLGIAPN